ncbi:hypothetical protein [Collimonas arenae]|uniref:hypothetical protein n=1 Tax=Collimonas arenae TaxID=279058 RepID=UPI0012E07A93|nr:hypothetical protein [Collimonas arenae]
MDKPLIHPINAYHMPPVIAGIDVHVGLAISVVLAVLAHLGLRCAHSGFALRVVGGNL